MIQFRKSRKADHKTWRKRIPHMISKSAFSPNCQHVNLSPSIKNRCETVENTRHARGTTNQVWKTIGRVPLEPQSSHSSPANISHMDHISWSTGQTIFMELGDEVRQVKISCTAKGKHPHVPSPAEREEASFLFWPGLEVSRTFLTFLTLLW